MRPTTLAGRSGTANCSNTTNGTAYGQAASVTVNGVTTTWTLANTAAEFKSGDQLLFVTNNGTVNKITTVVLTANATVTNTNTAVKFTFSPTNLTAATACPVTRWTLPLATAMQIAPRAISWPAPQVSAAPPG